MSGNVINSRIARLSLQLAVVLGALFASGLGLAMAADTPVPGDSRLKTIVAKKVIRIAYRADDRPFAFLNEAKEPLGYSIDLCTQVTKSIGQQFGVPDLKSEWVPVTVQTRFSAVASGKADMECGSSTVTLGRMKEVDFSSFIFVESTGIIVAKAANVGKFSDMAGKKIAVASGTTNEKAVVEQLKIQKIDAT